MRRRRERVRLFLRFFGVLLLPMWLGCARAAAPEQLLELRRVVESPACVSAEGTVPDLVVESRRSLVLAERAFERRDVMRSRWVASLGVVQARIATAMARQQEAEFRRSEAESKLRETEEDIARYRSQRNDVEAEIRRLEGLVGGDETGRVDSAPANGRGQ
jgi:hypothetical protein